MSRVIIVGGGIAGLSTAFELTRQAAALPATIDIQTEMSL